MTRALVLHINNPEPDNPRRWALDLAIESIRLRYRLPQKTSRDLTPIQPSAIERAHSLSADDVQKAIADRTAARMNGHYDIADAIRAKLLQNGVAIADRADRTTEWRYL